MTNLLATADDILNRANRVIGEVEGFVKDARSPLTETLKNTEVFTAALRDNADGIDGFLQSVGNLAETVKSLSGRIDTALASAENLINSVDPEKIDRILANVDKVTADVAGASGEISKTLESFSSAAGSLQTFAADAGASLDKVDKVISSVDPAKVGQTMDDIALASADARKALSDAREVVETFSSRKEDYDLIITNAKELTAKLNAASTRVDGVLAKVDGFLGEGDASHLLREPEATLKSFRDVADSLNARVGPIADNLERFSGSGLRNVEALVNDARRSIQRIERSISTIEQDPQRLIFGGETVKQYDGRTRR